MARYEASILGELWWPIGHPASLEVGFEADSDADAVASIDTHAGDFSNVLGAEVRRVERTSQMSDRVRETVTTVTVIQPWASEELEATYVDTVAGDWE